jgi:5-oxoprolinase (ATP-hydrolysing)
MDVLVTGEGQVIKKINLKYEGTNSTLMIDFNLNEELMRSKFEIEHQTRYGFTQPQKALIVESVTVEILQEMDSPEESILFRVRPLNENPIPREMVNIFSQDIWHSSPVYPRQELQPFDEITGPAIIVEKISTIVVEPNWNARLTQQNHLILQRI